MVKSRRNLHGYYFIERTGSIVIAKLNGGWNKETAQAFCRDFKEEVGPLKGAAWGHMVILDDWEMGIPGVDFIIKLLVDWCIDNGLTHAAHIYHHRTVTKYYVDTIVDKHRETFTRQIFDNEEQALCWLASVGYSTDEVKSSA